MGDIADDALPNGPMPPFYLKYTTIAGFFLQDDPSTDPKDFDYITSNLGLIDRAYPTDPSFDPDGTKTQWQRFAHYVQTLSRDSPKGTSVKLLYLARHGQGYHNVAESFYGTHDWDCHWSKLDGNGSIEWADAYLTPIGEDQARAARSFFAEKIKEGLPVPESWYVSPLERCLKTAEITWENLGLPDGKRFRPMVKELVREALGVHTCDRRSSLNYIKGHYPNYAIEEGFAEEDPLWDPDLRESDEHMVARLKALLDDVFVHDSNVFLSLTSHSGAIGAMLQALGHRAFRLQTGGIIPALVKAEKIDGPEPSKSIVPGIPAPTCEPTGARI